MVRKAYVHLVSTSEDALLDVVESAEAAFLDFGVSPDELSFRDCPVDEARRYAETTPGPDTGSWFPYLSPELLAELQPTGDDHIWHAGIEGMYVMRRVVREETAGDSAVVVQTDTRAGGSLVEYTVTRYDALGEEYITVAEG